MPKNKNEPKRWQDSFYEHPIIFPLLSAIKWLYPNTQLKPDEELESPKRERSSSISWRDEATEEALNQTHIIPNKEDIKEKAENSVKAWSAFIEKLDRIDISLLEKFMLESIETIIPSTDPNLEQLNNSSNKLNFMTALIKANKACEQLDFMREDWENRNDWHIDSPLKQQKAGTLDDLDEGNDTAPTNTVHLQPDQDVTTLADPRQNQL